MTTLNWCMDHLFNKISVAKPSGSKRRENERALMAPDFPSDLIQDIKIRLRQAAGLASYDPSDPSLPSIPSVSDAVAALDPTLPDHLRCRRCRGGLLRGINSTLCIFCGAEQRGDGISRKISFNSTAGCRKLLQSLDLDGSVSAFCLVRCLRSSDFGGGVTV